MRNSVISRVYEYAEKNKSVFLISGDAGYGVLDEYKGRFKDRYLNLGVAEQNMIGFAAGLGLAGYKVFVYNIAPFVLYRCYEQVRNDICYQRLPVTLIGIGSGVTYAPAGMTHYAVEDIALARTLPGLVILSPADPVEAERSIEFAFSSASPVYIRISKSGEPVIHKDIVKDITKPLIIRKGKDVAVLFHGSISAEIMDALEGLSRSPIVASIPMIQPLDYNALSEKLKGVHTIITIEEHFIQGGLGSIVAEWIANENLPIRLKRRGIPNEFIYKIKNTAGMRDFYGISSIHIRNAIEEAFNHG